MQRGAILGLEKVKDICKLGQGENCCRYLGLGEKGFECLKYTEYALQLDLRVFEKTITARGNNCPGIREIITNGTK